MKNTLGKVGIVVLSLLVTLVICEVGIRLVLRPVDYLSVTTERDPVLGWRIPPRASGHDSWGFRNPRVPQSADIVAIGDSHTYGNQAKMAEAWPSVLQGRVSRSVYNLGMGGYGPNQYFYLLQEKAFQLNPRTVVVAFFFGTNLENAFNITYGLDHWKYLRDSSVKEEGQVWAMTSPGGFGKKARQWLSCNSVIYQIVVHGPVLGSLLERFQIARARAHATDVAVLDVPGKNIHEAFVPDATLRAVDPARVSTREGLRITLKLFQEMNALCKARSIRFVVVLIPTKQTVFARYVEHNQNVRLDDVIDRQISAERLDRRDLLQGFDAAGIEYVDATSALQASIDREKLYTASTSDMHPNKNGYRIIGQCVARYLAGS